VPTSRVVFETNDEIDNLGDRGGHSQMLTGRPGDSPKSFYTAFHQLSDSRRRRTVTLRSSSAAP